MSIGALHRRSLTAVCILSALGVLSGSALLFVAGATLMIATLVASRSYDDVQRSKARVWAVHGVTLAALVFALSIFRQARIDAVLIVVMLGIFNRVMLRSGHRDDLVIMGAASVLVAAATTVTPGVEFALIIALFIPALLWSLWSSSMLGAAETCGRDGQLALVRARKVPPRMRRIALSGLLFTVLGFSAVSVLPRFRLTSLLRAGAFARLSGVSNSMTLTSGGVDKVRDESVMVRVEPRADRMDAGELAGLYARTYVLDRFDGRTWSSSDDGHFGFEREAAAVEVSRRNPAIRVTTHRMAVAGPHHPVAAIGRARPSRIKTYRVHQDFSGTWVVDRMESRTFWYDSFLDLKSPQVALTREWRASRDRKLSAVPETLDRRIVELGERLTRDEPNADGKIRAVLGHFGRGYEYSTDPLDGESEDPLTRFLFEAKKGHCELYAGAVAVLLRVAGMKTRVATGYYNGVWNDVGGYQAFAGQDAHAWVEVWVDGEGWRWIDATPEDLRVRRTGTGFFPRLKHLYDVFDGAWYDYVVDYESANARELFISTALRVHRGSQSFAAMMNETSKLARSTSGRGGGAVLLLLLLVGGLFGARSLLRRRSPVGLGRRLRRALGQRRGENVTLGMLLDRAAPAVKPEAALAVRRYEALRFGGEGQLGSTRAAIRALEGALRRSGD